MSTSTATNQRTCSRDGVQMHAEESALRGRMGGTRQQLPVSSGEAGVGKSTIAANPAPIAAFAEEVIGGRWTGVTLHYDGIPEGTLVCQDMRLCEAVARSLSETIVLPADRIDCPGARRSLALDKGAEELARRVKNEFGIALAYRVVKDTPHLATPPAALTLGQQEHPDVVIGYIRPDLAMNLIRRWQQRYETGPTVKLTSFMAICGDVLVGAHESQQLRLCFGCPDSRKYGKIQEEALVVGMPHSLATLLLQEGH